MVKYSILEAVSERELADLELPVLIKNKELMGPGTWNDTNYTALEINKAFDKTDWNDKDNISLFLDHKDRETTCWVGWVKNPRKGPAGIIMGDLEIWDENIARKLIEAKAKFGISPKLRGKEAKDNSLKNFTFENFSVVTKPACKTAYINLIQKDEGGRETMKDVRYLEEEDAPGQGTAPEGEEKKDKEQPKETPKEEPDKKPEETKENQGDGEEEDKKKKPEEEEMSQEELLEITVLSDWTGYFAKMRQKEPKLSVTDIAKSFKEMKKQSEELSKLSDSEVLSKIDELSNVLKDRKKIPPEEEEKKEMKQLKDEVKKLSEKLKKPDAKTITLEQPKEVIKSNVGFTEGPTQGEVEMAKLLSQQLGEDF